MSAWKKPSRMAWRRKRLDHRAAELRQVEALWPRARRDPTAACRRSIRASARPLPVRFQSTVGTRKSGSSLVFSAISESAAASSRRSISIVTERASVSTTSISRSRRASAENFSAVRAAKKKCVEIDLEAPLDAGPQHLDGDRSPLRGHASARCTCAIEAAATGGPNEENSSRHRLADLHLDHALRLRLRERRHLVLQVFEIARERSADDVRTRREELAELDVGRAERGQRGRQAMPARRSGRSIRRAIAQRAARRQRQQRGIDQPEHALAREHEAGARQTREMGDRADHKRQPECSATMPPVIGVNVTRRKPAARIMSAKTFGRGNLRIDSTR